MAERALASVRVIDALEPIPNADAIEVATIDGWKVVVKKGEYRVGDKAVYLEIDSWVPFELAPFLVKNAAKPREYMGIQGERLKTIKLRGQISQGLLIDLKTAATYVGMRPGRNLMQKIATCFGIKPKLEGDVTEKLGIIKWEPPLPAELAGKAKGNFPTHLWPKTDEERIQNCFKYLSRRDPEETYEVTVKMDGSSCTLARFEGELRVCSRNLELKIDDDNATNSFVAIAMRYGEQVPDGFAVQGELWGESIQDNLENVKGHHFSVFKVFDVANQKFLLPEERRAFCVEHGFEHVKVLETIAVAPNSVADALAMAEGPSLHAKIREGIVYKSNSDPNHSFKAISNSWLLKTGK
jgi:RNA ligase (TIGR02306 family)